MATRFSLTVLNQTGQRIWVRLQGPSCVNGALSLPAAAQMGSDPWRMFNVTVGIPAEEEEPGVSTRGVTLLEFWRADCDITDDRDCSGEQGQLQAIASYDRVIDDVDPENLLTINFNDNGVDPSLSHVPAALVTGHSTDAGGATKATEPAMELQRNPVNGVWELRWIVRDAVRTAAPVPKEVEEVLTFLVPILSGTKTKGEEEAAHLGPLFSVLNPHEPPGDRLGLAAQWKARAACGSPYVAGLDEPFAEGVRKPQWYQLLKYPVPPPPPSDGGVAHSKWWDGIFNVLTLAAFSLGGAVGAGAAAGVAAVGMLPRLLGAPPKAAGSTYDWVLDLKRATSTEVQQAITQSEQAEIFAHFQNFSDHVGGLLRGHWTKALTDGVVEHLRNEVDALLDVRTEDMLTFLVESGPGRPQYPDLALYPSFQEVSLTLFVQCFSLWLWAAKLGAILYATEDPTVEGLQKKMKEGLQPSIFQSRRSQAIVSNTLTMIEPYCKAATSSLAAMEEAIAERVRAIDVTECWAVGGWVKDGHIITQGTAMTERIELSAQLSVRDSLLGKDGVADKTNGGLTPYATGLDRKNAVAQGSGSYMTPQLAGSVYADGRAWMCHIARYYARRWGYTQTDSDGSVHCIRPYVERTVARWEEIYDVFDNLQYEDPPKSEKKS